jgi:hypothetical protein
MDTSLLKNKKMNVLFSYTGYPSPVLETMLELVELHKEKNDNITIIQCKGELNSCFWNTSHNKLLCNLCKSKFNNAYNLIEEPNIKLYEFKNQNNNEISYKFDDINELKYFNYKELNIGLGVASRLITLFRDHKFNTIDKKAYINSELKSAIQIVDYYENLFKSETYNEVYIFNGRITTEYPLILLCKKYKINFYTFEVSSARNKYLLRKNSTAHSIDSTTKEMDFLWDNANENKYKIAKSWFENKINRYNIDKIENFVKSQVKGSLPINFNKNIINIGIFNSSIDEYSSIGGWENPLYIDDNEGINKILESFMNIKGYHFYLRVHPFLKNVGLNSQIKEIINLKNKYNNLTVIMPNDKCDSYELMQCCNIVITFSSTIGIESAYWGIPTILGSRAFYENLDCIYKPKNHDELISLLMTKNLKPLINKSALKQGYWELTNGELYKYFKEIKIKNNLAQGSFKGIIIKPDYIYYFQHKLINLSSKIKNILAIK